MERFDQVDSSDGTLAVQTPSKVTRRSRTTFLLPLLAVLVVSVLASLFIKVPYRTLSPGSARSIEPLIESAGDAPAFPSDGEVLFTTVSVSRDRISLAEAVVGWLDDEIDVIDEDLITGGRSADENRQFNLQLMDTSKIVAIQVALQAAGFELTPSGAQLTQLDTERPIAELMEIGDVIVAIDGAEVDESSDVVEAVQALDVGDTVEIEFLDSAGDRQSGAVETGDNPDTEEEDAFLGVALQTFYTRPFDIDIDSGDVGGPSAGLAFTLGLLDYLTEGELTGGQPIAVTGTINPDGTVGPVGGVEQKTLAARRAGAVMFIVPTAEFAEATERSGDDIEIVAADTLGEALEALEQLGGNAAEVAVTAELAFG